jgi:hypothetical protein
MSFHEYISFCAEERSTSLAHLIDMGDRHVLRLCRAQKYCVVGGAGRKIGGGAEKRGKSAGDCSVGVFCVVGLCLGLERGRNHKNRTKWGGVG